MKAQPYNFILAPTFQYRTAVAACDDQFLLMMVCVLKGAFPPSFDRSFQRVTQALGSDLETETNFAYHIKEMDWANLVRPLRIRCELLPSLY